MTLDCARRRAVVALFGPAACCAWRTAQAQAQGLGLLRESAVKAAFLFKFGGFVEWPPGTFRSPTAPFVIGVFGDDAVAAELDQLTRGRDVNGHPVRVVRVRGSEDIESLQVLYAGGPRESRVREMLAAVRGPVLTVADAGLTGWVPPVLAFTQDEGRLRFTASLTAARARGLKLSSRLLAVAQSVEGH